MKKLVNPQFNYGGAGFIDAAGNFIGGGERTAVGQSLQQFQANMAATTNCQPKGNYVFPKQFNLNAVNGTGAAVLYKFTQADNMTESLINSIGAAWFTVQQLPFGNASITKQDGTLINGAETLARSLQTYGMKIGKIIATGTALANTSTLVINAWRGNLSGAGQEDWTLNLDQTNGSATTTFSVTFDGNGMDLTSNVSFRVSVPATSSLSLQFIPVGIIPYL